MTPLREWLRVLDAKAPYDGPYDVEGAGYAVDDEGTITVTLNLGMVLDFYHLELACKSPASWDLWHMDSAVCHVDVERIGEGVRFETGFVGVDASDLEVRVQAPEGGPNGAAASFLVEKVTVDTKAGADMFAVTFLMAQGSRLVFDARGWALWSGEEATAPTRPSQVTFSNV